MHRQYLVRLPCFVKGLGRVFIRVVPYLLYSGTMLSLSLSLYIYIYTYIYIYIIYDMLVHTCVTKTEYIYIYIHTGILF